jgi:hypothetical protein
MTSGDPNAIRSPSPRRALTIVWVVFLSALFAFGSYKSSINRRDDEMQAQWRAKIDQRQKEIEIEWPRRTAWIRSLPKHPDSRQKLETEFNGGQPFDLNNDGRRQTLKWSDPIYGGELELTFENGVLIGHGAHWGTGRLGRLYPQPAQLGSIGWTESWRLALIRPSIGVWISALIAAIAFSGQRELFAQVMLAAALTCGTAWLLHPHYSWTWNGIFSNDMLFFAVPMIAFGVAMTANAMAARPDAIRPRYSLRMAFIAMTVAALLLATGPFGYMALAVATGCLLLGWAVYQVARARTRQMQEG